MSSGGTLSVVDIVEAVHNDLTFSQDNGATFGHGPLEFRNLHGDTEEEPPLLTWLEDFSIDDTMRQAGVLEHQYNLAILFGKQTDLTADAPALKTLIRDMELMSKEFIHRFIRHECVDVITALQRQPMYFQDDFGLTGYLLLVRTKLEFEKFNLHCVDTSA